MNGSFYVPVVFLKCINSHLFGLPQRFVKLRNQQRKDYKWLNKILMKMTTTIWSNWKRFWSRHNLLGMLKFTNARRTMEVQRRILHHFSLPHFITLQQYYYDKTIFLLRAHHFKSHWFCSVVLFFKKKKWVKTFSWHTSQLISSHFRHKHVETNCSKKLNVKWSACGINLQRIKFWRNEQLPKAEKNAPQLIPDYTFCVYFTHWCKKSSSSHYYYFFMLAINFDDIFLIICYS